MGAFFLVVLFTTLVPLFRFGSATSILLPLYVYPAAVFGDGGANWVPLYNALGNHTSVQFIIIINPPPGGTLPNNGDPQYIAGISKLNSYSNALLIGYVDTAYTQKPLAVVEANISTYAGWANYSSANISMHGIFFDDVTNDDSSTNLTYIADAAAYARSAIPGAFVVYNPGTYTSDKYFSPVPPNLIVEFENFASQWNGNTTIDQFPQDELARSAVLVHDEPSVSEAQSIVRECAAKGLGAVWVTPDSVYANLSYVDAIASVLDS